MLKFVYKYIDLILLRSRGKNIMNFALQFSQHNTKILYFKIQVYKNK